MNLLLVFVVVLFLFIISYLIKKLRLIIISQKAENNGESSLRNKFPPGSRGWFPYIGETIQLFLAIYSKQGFYSFVKARHFRESLKNLNRGRLEHRARNDNKIADALAKDGRLGHYLLNDYIALSRAPDFCRELLVQNSMSIGEIVGTKSLLCASSNQSHKQLRRNLIDLFNSHAIADVTKQFDELVVTNLSTWQHSYYYSSHLLIILDQALQMTFKAMCKMLLSLEAENELQKDITCVSEAMLAFPLKFPWTCFTKGLKARKRIMEMLDKMIQERRVKDSTQDGLDFDDDHHPKDFLESLLIQARDRETQSSGHQASTLTDAHIKDNILTMIIAGQDTTASAMTWMVKYLDENQGVLNTLLDEAQHIEKRKANKDYLTLEDLTQMTFATKVIRESLRMASIVPWFPRVALQDCTISGYSIKKGWNVNVDARSLHFDPTLYQNPHKFIPSRFDNEPKAYSYLAFGAGGRTCLGMNLARNMMLVFLYRLLTTYKWKVTDPDSSVENWALFSRLKSGCPIKVTKILQQKDN